MKLTSSKIMVIIQFVTSAYIFLSGTIKPESGILFMFMLLSLILATWAIASIRLEHLKISPEINPGSELITHGPYKVIRHPMYTSLLLLTFCLVLNDFSVLRFSVWAILFLNLLVKISVEEKLLANHYSGYTEYQSKTKKLIPFIL